MVNVKNFCFLVITCLLVGARFDAKADSNLVTTSISDINQHKAPNGTLIVSGYVSEIYQCPACPKGAFCEPCMAPNFILSEEYPEKDLFGQLAAYKRLVVFAQQASSFKLASKLKLRVNFENKGENTVPCSVKLLSVEN